MFKPKQILVPVDFSQASWRALEAASTLARSYGAALDVIHVWDVPMMARSDEVSMSAALQPSVVEAVSNNAHVQLAKFVSEAVAHGHTFRKASAVAGEPYQTIIDTAEAGRYDLIVIGTHGRTRLARLILGSVAERVVRYAKCSVLVARARDEAAQATP